MSVSIDFPLRATYASLLALPEGVRAEVLNGKLITLPAPMPRHANVQGVLRTKIGVPYHDDHGFGGPGGWWIFLEVDVCFGPHDILLPDLSGWRRSRLASPDQRPIDVVPDWCCEIVSPSSVRTDRVLKRRLYAEHGVKHYWIIDPDTRTLEALELRDGLWVELGVYDENNTVAIAPFIEAELVIDRLFLPKSLSAEDVAREEK